MEKEFFIYLLEEKNLINNLPLIYLKKNQYLLICGHFEGVDERVLSTRNIEEISIGDYVLSGGETAAFVVYDSILKIITGCLGNEKSHR